MAESELRELERAHAAFNRGDWEAALSATHPEVEWRWHGNLALDADQFMRGRDAIREAWADFFAVWDSYEMRLVELAEAPGGRVLASILFRATGQGSGVPIEMPQFYLWRFRDGRVVTVDVYDDRDAALEAAGLAV